MNSVEIVRSWKDEDYRRSLSADQQSLAPGNPVGLLELDDEDLIEVGGGTDLISVILITCTLVTTIIPPVTGPAICRYRL
jgi:mersacidin/lichenicidin family type 2 lantibiotic